MPLHVAAQGDPITGLIRFRTSSLFQTLVSLQSVTHPWRHRDWTERVRQALGEEFYTAAHALYERFHNGCDFAEMAIDYPDYHDFPGFLESVAAMPPRTFAFYVLGRIYPPEEIPETLSEQSVYALVREHGNLEHFQHTGVTFEWAGDVPGLQRRLVGLWRTYWEGFFRERLPEYEKAWEHGIREKEEVLYRSGGTALLQQITGCESLPPPMPEDRPVTVVQMIPACLMPRSYHMYYGYGKATVVYDCTRSPQQELEAERSRDAALAMLRALADENRLRILRVVGEEEFGYNGRKIAEKLGLSPSVVSRHLGQLKEAGLVKEHSPDNRNILYSAQRDRIAELPGLLLRYLND